MRRYDTIIFDLDGTLLNTLEDLKDAVNHALHSFGMPERTLDQIKAFVGNGVRRLVELSVPEGESNPVFEDVFEAFRSYYALHCNDKTAAYPGVVDLLKRLRKKGYAMAIVSNKLDSAVKELNEVYFEGIVSVAIGEQEGIQRKPNPDMVYKALKELGASGQNAVYIGDSEVDLMTAKNAGLPCISVLWGFRDKGFLQEKGAKVFAETPAEIENRIGSAC